MSFLDKVFSGLPEIDIQILAILLSFTFSYSILITGGKLKKKYGFETGYSRKLFHFSIFLIAACIHTTLGLSYLCLMGLGVSTAVGTAIIQGAGSNSFECIARHRDYPYRRTFIIIPYFSTLIGGLITGSYFEQFATIGFIVSGMGDASGEVIGLRFGKRKYHIFKKTYFRTSKSFEGSLAVFLVSSIALFIFLLLTSHQSLIAVISISIGIGFISSIVEIITPRGIDNITLQTIPTALYACIITI